VNEDTAERIAAGAPENVRETFLRSVIPGLGHALTQVRANPARIKRCNARQARRIVSLIDDPLLLVKIAKHEQRVSVREKLRENPAWHRAPHETTCVHCRENPTFPLDDMRVIRAAVGTREERLVALGAPDVCPEKLLRTLQQLHGSAQTELWRTAFSNTLGHSARAHVELAAGRTPLDPGSVPAWGGRNQPLMRRLLANEPAPTPGLLDLAVGARLIPSHWDIDAAQWGELLRTHDIGVLASEPRIPIHVLTGAWEALSSRARVSSLAHAETCGELEILLELLEEADIAEARSREPLARGVITVLERFQDLDAGRRLGLVSLLPRRELGEYLLGRLGVVPDPEQIDDLLILYNLGQGYSSYRFLIDMAGRSETAGEHRSTRHALIDALLRVARPAELFAGENRVSEAAHAYTWQRLDDEHAVTAFAGLIDEWAGTLPDLVESARELGR